jgi:hypothetical protein
VRRHRDGSQRIKRGPEDANRGAAGLAFQRWTPRDRSTKHCIHLACAAGDDTHSTRTPCAKVERPNALKEWVWGWKSPGDARRPSMAATPHPRPQSKQVPPWRPGSSVAQSDPKRATGAASSSWRKDTPLATRMRTSLRRSVLGTAWAKLIIISRPRNEKVAGRSA